ncbi:MAG: lysophospholipid acyltransferase family protein [Tannerellaceae bacterium]|jgi:putative hemolysin|nr:lysophospholipid acyltransferase family protein [Tannerellaceae bacterium]
MRKNVLDIAYLQAVSPFFKSKAGIYTGNKLIKWLGIEKVNTVHARNSHLRGAEFTTALLKDPLINLSYEVHNAKVLDTLPPGAFITVSNHPIGSLDGVILIDIFASRRPDFRVMANGILTNIGAMKDNFISVKPNSGNQGPNVRNVNGIRMSLAHLHEGSPMGFFPSGAISFCSKNGEIRDLPWTHNIIRLIRKASVPVYPVYFDLRNSRFFYFLGKISWRIRTLRIPAEAFNKQGRKANVYLGKPIMPEEIQTIPDDNRLAEFLYTHTYAAKKWKSLH